MKTIELLSKVINGEISAEVPCRTLYEDISPTNWKSIRQMFAYCNDLEDLDRKVEIIEESNKIEKLEHLNLDIEENHSYATPNEYLLESKINQIIDKLNSLEKEG